MTMRLLGMMRYELLMHWRRGWLRIVFVGFTAAPVLIALIMSEAWTQLPEEMANDIEAASRYAVMATLVAWPIVLVAVPILSADTIPLDTKYNMRPLLDSFPLPLPLYLVGKLFGVWGGVIPVLALGCVVGLLALWLLIAPFDVGLWLRLWLFGLLFLTLVNTGLTVLLASICATRRQAVMLAFALIPVCLSIFSISSLFRYYIAAFSQQLTGDLPILTLREVALGTGVILLSGLAGWAALRRQA